MLTGTARVLRGHPFLQRDVDEWLRGVDEVAAPITSFMLSFTEENAGTGDPRLRAEYTTAHFALLRVLADGLAPPKSHSRLVPSRGDHYDR